jgi:hypothetical protein
MNLLSRLIMLMIMSIAFAAPVNAAVSVDIDGYCDAVAADDGKKDDGKKTGGEEGEEEPDCE